MIVRNVYAVWGAVVLALGLSACGSAIDADGAASGIMVPSDFAVDMKPDESLNRFTEPEGDYPTELFNAGDNCASQVELFQILGGGKSLAAAHLEERNDSQTYAQVVQEVIELGSPEEVEKVVALAKNAIDDPACRAARTDYSNVRTVDEAFGVSADTSVVWDGSSSADPEYVALFGTGYNYESGVAIAGKGPVLVISRYFVDSADDATETVSRSDLETGLTASIGRLLG